jgi:putative SOS response-associated peptidase YedK
MLHDRMPVILDPAEEAAWLDPATPEPLLRELLVSCLDPPAAEAEPTLF